MIAPVPQRAPAVAPNRGYISLTHVLSIPQVARLAGWRRERMFKHLMRHNRRMGGGLLFNAGNGSKRPRWTVSVGALKNLHREWFSDPEQTAMAFEYLHERVSKGDDRTEALEGLVRHQGQVISMLVEWVGERRRAG